MRHAVTSTSTSLILVWLRPVARTRRYGVMSSGSRNAVWRISPGVMGACALVMMCFSVVSSQSVVVGDLDLRWPVGRPAEADPALVIDTDGVLAPCGRRSVFRARYRLTTFESLGGVIRSALSNVPMSRNRKTVRR